MRQPTTMRFFPVRTPAHGCAFTRLRPRIKVLHQATSVSCPPTMVSRPRIATCNPSATRLKAPNALNISSRLRTIAPRRKTSTFSDQRPLDKKKTRYRREYPFLMAVGLVFFSYRWLRGTKGAESTRSEEAKGAERTRSEGYKGVQVVCTPEAEPSAAMSD